jgi:hypothetical protein
MITSMITSMITVGLMAALVAAGAAGLAVVATMTWLGVRNGDQLGDLLVDVRIEADERPGAAIAAVTLDNPGERPVVTAVRVGTVSWATWWLSTSRIVHRTMLRPGLPPDDALLEVVPERSSRRLMLPVDTGRRRPVRVDVLAYQQPGRVRLVSHRIRPIGTAKPAVAASRSLPPAV